MSTSLRERPPPRPLAPRLPREGRRRSLTRRLSERPRRPDSLDPEAKDRVRQRPGQRQGETRTETVNRGDQAGTGQTRTGQGRTDQDSDSQQGRPGKDRDRTRTGTGQTRTGTANGETRQGQGQDKPGQGENKQQKREERVRGDGLGQVPGVGSGPKGTDVWWAMEAHCGPQDQPPSLP